MSKNPTVAQLVSSATAQMTGLTEDQARTFIRNNEIRSMGKLKTMITELASKTTEEIAAACEPVAAQRADRTAKKSASKASKPAAKKAAASEKKFERKPRAARKIVEVKPGPRGFRFGDVWVTSVKSGEGVALMESNKNKLLKHAETVGINRFTKANDSATIAKAIAAKL